MMKPPVVLPVCLGDRGEEKKESDRMIGASSRYQRVECRFQRLCEAAIGEQRELVVSMIPQDCLENTGGGIDVQRLSQPATSPLAPGYASSTYAVILVVT